MANIYCTATNTGKGFITTQDYTNFFLSGHDGDVWVVEDNEKGALWVSRNSGTPKTTAEAQAIVDAEVDAAIIAYDAKDEVYKTISTKPVRFTLPQEELKMATYRGIKGWKVQVVASDPSNLLAGQIWYNSATNLLKYYDGSTTKTVTVS